MNMSAANAFETHHGKPGVGSAAAHTDVLLANAFQTDHNGELVRIEGRLITRNTGLEGSTLILASEGIVFTALLPADVTGNDRRLDSS